MSSNNCRCVTPQSQKTVSSDLLEELGLTSDQLGDDLPEIAPSPTKTEPKGECNCTSEYLPEDLVEQNPLLGPSYAESQDIVDDFNFANYSYQKYQRDKQNKNHKMGPQYIRYPLNHEDYPLDDFEEERVSERSPSADSEKKQRMLKNIQRDFELYVETCPVKSKIPVTTPRRSPYPKRTVKINLEDKEDYEPKSYSQSLPHHEREPKNNHRCPNYTTNTYFVSTFHDPQVVKNLKSKNPKIANNNKTENVGRPKIFVQRHTDILKKLPNCIETERKTLIQPAKVHKPTKLCALADKVTQNDKSKDHRALTTCESIIFMDCPSSPESITSSNPYSSQASSSPESEIIHSVDYCSGSSQMRIMHPISATMSPKVQSQTKIEKTDGRSSSVSIVSKNLLTTNETKHDDLEPTSDSDSRPFLQNSLKSFIYLKPLEVHDYKNAIEILEANKSPNSRCERARSKLLKLQEKIAKPSFSYKYERVPKEQYQGNRPSLSNAEQSKPQGRRKINFSQFKSPPSSHQNKFPHVKKTIANEKKLSGSLNTRSSSPNTTGAKTGKTKKCIAIRPSSPRRTRKKNSHNHQISTRSHSVKSYNLESNEPRNIEKIPLQRMPLDEYTDYLQSVEDLQKLITYATSSQLPEDDLHSKKYFRSLLKGTTAPIIKIPSRKVITAPGPNVQNKKIEFKSKRNILESFERRYSKRSQFFIRSTTPNKRAFVGKTIMKL
ncbi:hypothetical protein FQA39_LY02985 [Lamprigera yunnana]|nr:hypothetical protein FQA39_LY02985 [Lamprigera yunnana]